MKIQILIFKNGEKKSDKSIHLITFVRYAKKERTYMIFMDEFISILYIQVGSHLIPE